jgi:threonine aldolase
VLAGDADFIAEARVWRRRLGGTLYHQSPMVASAAMRLDARLAQLDACYERALALAKALSGIPGLRVNPNPPHINMMHLYFEAPAETVLERRDAIAERDGVWVIGGAKLAEVPGWSVGELYVGDTLVGLEDDDVVPRFRELLGLSTARRRSPGRLAAAQPAG